MLLSYVTVKYVSLEQKENHVNNAAEFSEVVDLVFFFFKKKSHTIIDETNPSVIPSYL